jgi:hypothetical protein
MKDGAYLSGRPERSDPGRTRRRAILAVQLTRDELAAAAKERMLNGKKDPQAKSPEGEVTGRSAHRPP